MTDKQQVFASNLERLRKRKGLTKKELAELIGVHWNTVNRWEKGEVMPSVEVLLKLAEILDASLDDFFEEKAPPFVGYYDVLSLPPEQRFEKIFELAGKHAGFNGPILHALGDRVFKDAIPKLETEEEIVREYEKWRKWWEEKKKLLLEG